MSSRAQLQANVGQHKEKHPELYCPERRCLWRTGDGTYCPRHKPMSVRESVLAQLQKEGRRV